jgi:S1-C subfamily serine protease
MLGLTTSEELAMVTVPSRSALSKANLVAALLAAWLCVATTAQAQAQLSPDGPELRAKIEALVRTHAAVVGVRSTAVEEAGSIATLGRERRGSGVLIGDDGLVLTIGYLILEADHVDLVIEGERTVPARVVAYDIASGFGLLQALTPVRVPPVPLGNSTALAADLPLVIASGGAAGGLSLARLVSQRPFSGYWEYHIDGAVFTTPPRPDHSGAGLFNLDGELLGIGSLVVADAAGAGQGRIPGNMFVPIDLLKPILGELRAQGASRSSTRAWLGLNCVEGSDGVRVMRVTRDGPADLAGLEPGDQILRVDGADVAGLESFYKSLWRSSPERDVALEIRRDGQTQTITARSRDRMKTLSKPQGI